MSGEPRLHTLAADVRARFRTMTLAARRMDADQPFTGAQLSVLDALIARPRRMGALAAELGVRLPTMTEMVARLERAGLVARRLDPDDRRVSMVDVTDLGRTTAKRLNAERNVKLAARLALLTETERRAIAAALPVLDRLCATDPEPAKPVARASV